MGTWGTGPFDNDAAEDFLDEIEGLSVSRRVQAVQETFGSIVRGEEGRASPALQVEVIAAAAICALNVSREGETSWAEDYPGISEWLEPKALPELSGLAVRALGAAVPADSWFWRSWANDHDRNEIEEVVNRIRSVLESVAS
ncbi:DUF4259 domain-containing protein [Streptosporangium sp. NPDC023963]|uniref:DUF4259 domain-containing protein n=1 Tax=Streptosporangium sp. NPDC023963 TaxID=3155608 RepID=UPI0034407E44